MRITCLKGHISTISLPENDLMMLICKHSFQTTQQSYKYFYWLSGTSYQSPPSISANYILPYVFEQMPPLNSTHVQTTSDNGHHSVIWAISTADSRTENLHILLTASNNRHRLTRHWCLQVFQRNKHRPRIVAAQNKQQKNSSCGVWSKNTAF